MSNSASKKEYSIDAANLPLGRAASRAASLLMGKGEPDFRRNRPPQVSVTITNANKLYLPRKKQASKKYFSYSGFPGGLKALTLALVVQRKGVAFVLRRAVYGMLPKNRLRDILIKHLKIIG